MTHPAVLVVTGGTGTGKSTVAGWLRERGAFVIDADRVGHEMLLEPAVVESVAAHFGPEVVRDGRIDRSVLGPRVFADPEALRALEAIVHPGLLAEVARRVEAARRSRAPRLIVVDAALHFRFSPPPEADAVLMTVAPREIRQERIMARDGIDAGVAADRLDRQADLDGFVDRADVVVDTRAERATVRREVFAAVDRLFGLDLLDSDPAAIAAPPTPEDGHGND